LIWTAGLPYQSITRSVSENQISLPLRRRPRIRENAVFFASLRSNAA